jgi:transposase
VTIGIEGSGSWGAGLAQFLVDHGHQVVEVQRPSRPQRRGRGKSDPTDAEAAARAALAGTAAPIKNRDGLGEMIRSLRTARRSAAEMRTDALNRMRALVVTAPHDLRDQLRDLSVVDLVKTCQRLRPGSITDPRAATKLALRSLARRIRSLEEELRELDAHLLELTKRAKPELLAIKGVGPDVAGTLIVTAGDNPHRLHSEAAFARLCGVAPLPASSGRTDRHRLNRGGDRQADKALWRIVISRIRSRDQPTIHYLERRMAQGLTKRETIRCLKRYVAREVYQALTS